MLPRSRLLPVAVIGVVALFAAFLAAEPAAAATQPNSLWLPWEAGQSWHYTNGPHSGGAALDFQPPDAAGRACDGFQSSYWIVAAAAGRVININNGLEIDHGNGLRTGYLHVAQKQVTSGRVDAGDRLGTVSCCPEGWSASCYATAPHLHFYTSYRGYKQEITGVNLDGWVVQGDGCLLKGDKKACTGGWLTSTAPLHTPANVDLVLVVDNSVSMLFEDRSSARLNSIRSLLAASLPGDRVGVVAFDAEARRLFWMREARSHDIVRWAFLHGITRFGAVSATDIAAGLHTACNELISSGKAQNRGAILLTDGVHTRGDFSNTQQCFRNHGWPVHTIAFGAAGEDLLRKIAADTGGEFSNAKDIPNISCHIQRLRALVAGVNSTHCATAAVRPGANISISLPMPPGRAQAVLTATWPGGDGHDPTHLADLGITLVSPSGHHVSLDKGDADGPREAGETFRTYTVAAPEAGDWSVRLNGRAVPAEGLEVTISLSTIEDTPFPVFPTPTPSPTSPDSPSETPTDTPTDTETPTPDPSGTTTPDPTSTEPPGTQPPPPLPTETPTPTPEPPPTPAPSPPPPT